MAAAVVETTPLHTPFPSPQGGPAHFAEATPSMYPPSQQAMAAPYPPKEVETHQYPPGRRVEGAEGAPSSSHPAQVEVNDTQIRTSPVVKAQSPNSDGTAEASQAKSTRDIQNGASEATDSSKVEVPEVTSSPRADTGSRTDNVLQFQPPEDEGHLTLRDELVGRVWEEFATDFLAGSCNIQQAAILDLETQRPLAINGGLQISADEMAQLVASLYNYNLAYRNGVTLGGRHYKVRLADGRNGLFARTGTDGCTVCRTHTLVIVGVHDHRGNSRKCNEDVMRLGDYFRKKAL